MSPLDAVRSVFSQYATFKGRARRSEYCWFALFNVVVAVVARALDSALFGTALADGGVLSGLFGLAVLVPTLAVSWRRLHDTDRSGGWWFIGLIPIIGTIILIVFYVKDSDPGDNRFGPSPKAGPAWSSVGYGPGYGQP